MRSRNSNSFRFSFVLCALVLTACGQDSGTEGKTCPDEQELCGSTCCAYSCCDGKCVDTKTEKEHCGNCTNACHDNEICQDGTCSEKTEVCKSGEKMCGESCVDVKNDEEHCGNCETVCEPDETCQNGKCRSQCPENTVSIGDTCIDPMTDSLHCGLEDVACGPDMYCADGKCACMEGSFDCDGDVKNGCESSTACFNCTSDEEKCLFRCANLKTDTENCGECENRCLLTQKCEDGKCVSEAKVDDCKETEVSCYGNCVDLKTDNDNCGGCLNKCQTGFSCEGGACILKCKDELENCDDVCTDLQTSDQHCGGCHVACGAGQSCNDGICECKTGFYDCDGNTANGCESSTVCACEAGSERKCWPGAEDNVKSKEPLELYGICKPGTQKCDESGQSWGPCIGSTLPSAITCDDAGYYLGGDQNCNGIDDETEECRSECDFKTDETSYIGCEYWPVFLQNNDGNSSRNIFYDLSLVISNPSSDKDAIIYIFDKPAFENTSRDPYLTFTVPAGGVVHKTIVGDPSASASNQTNANVNKEGTTIFDYMLQNTVIRPTAFKLRSTEPVVVYQFNPYGKAAGNSSDASLMLPRNALATEYMTMGFTSTPNLVSGDTISVVAVSPGETTVRIKVKADMLAGVDERDKTTIQALKAGGEDGVFKLRQFDALSLQQAGAGESSGTTVTADKKIEVFGGAACAYIPSSKYGGCDHMEEQLLPLDMWGMRYAAVRTMPQKDEPNFYYILAQSDNTNVRLTGPSSDSQASGTFSLNSGEFRKIETKSSFDVIADKPVYVGQFLVSITYSGASAADPSFISMVPVEQYRKTYSFSVPSGYTADYVTIVTPKGNVIKYTGDGHITNKTQIPYADTRLEDLPTSVFSGFKEFGTEGYVYGYLDLDGGIHHLEGEMPFGLTGYGYYGYTSYGYPIGLELARINKTN